MSSKILLVNDDGISAEGLLALELSFAKVDVKLVTVAPDQERSSCGHSISLNDIVRLKEVAGQARFACSGSPADCAILGIHEFSPDIVISGINAGGNLGQDLYYSGTVAGAREACFKSLPGISLSLVTEYDEKKSMRHFSVAAHFAALLIKRGFAKYIPAHSFLNINVPNCSQAEIQGIELTLPGLRTYRDSVEKREDLRGREYFWLGGKVASHHKFFSEKSDIEAILERKISISLISLNETAEKEKEALNNFISDLEKEFCA